ncbi:MAG: hypothetical protein E3J43_07700 [Candidatus Heimdallarchaeota archaeon]|nr:MAG: hypothetical protein E3J43_07700 [Candidatus Heimdallarchaeota archaeon]
MNRNYLTKISFISILITILIINSSLQSSAATRDWYVGTSVKYAFILSESEKTTTTIDALEGFEYCSEEMEIRLDIISIDLGNHEFVANVTSAGIGMGEYDGFTDAGVISGLLADNLFDIDYRWDEKGNSVLLTDFDMDIFAMFFFIEPEWEIFNINMGRLLDRTKIVDIVTDGLWTTYEITFGDFLDSIVSYDIMGVKDIVGSEFTLSNSTTKWSFSFDLSNVIYKRVHGTHVDSYFPYSTYTVSYTLDFTEGGTLNLLEYNMITKVTTDDAVIEEVSSMIIQKGGFESVRTPFNFSYSLLSLMVLPVLIYFSKKKKRLKSGVINNA